MPTPDDYTAATDDLCALLDGLVVDHEVITNPCIDANPFYSQAVLYHKIVSTLGYEWERDAPARTSLYPTSQRAFVTGACVGMTVVTYAHELKIKPANIFEAVDGLNVPESLDVVPQYAIRRREVMDLGKMGLRFIGGDAGRYLRLVSEAIPNPSKRPLFMTALGLAVMGARQYVTSVNAHMQGMEALAQSISNTNPPDWDGALSRLTDS